MGLNEDLETILEELKIREVSDVTGVKNLLNEAKFDPRLIFDLMNDEGKLCWIDIIEEFLNQDLIWVDEIEKNGDLLYLKKLILCVRGKEELLPWYNKLLQSLTYEPKTILHLPTSLIDMISKDFGISYDLGDCRFFLSSLGTSYVITFFAQFNFYKSC